MLSPREAMDAPTGIDSGASDEQARIRALGINLGQFVKTMRGRTLIINDQRFVLQGKLYQGFNERAIDCAEDLCTQAEIDAAEDVDGTKQTLLDTRARRLAGNTYSKDQELGARRKIKIAQERDELELRRLQREEAKYLLSQASEPDPEPEAEPEPEIHACTACGKQFGNARGLNAHKMGAKH